MVSHDFWSNRNVLITGHTGFKGAWLSLWLSQLGARVHGMALEPPSYPSFYEVVQVSQLLKSDLRVDIRDGDAVARQIGEIQPEVIFHLAAQPLVSYGYQQPIETYATNVMGTLHVLEASRQTPSVQAMVVVTTDKCYDNREWVYPYRETDRLGGADPYSNSKACAELVVSAYRQSFFSPLSLDSAVAVATARAGNVIGGGDWADNRLIPDCIRAFQSGKPVTLRYPQAVRPWQHVLEPLWGYLSLAESLLGERSQEFCQGWNFGPDVRDSLSVGEVASLAAQLWGDGAEIQVTAPGYHEARTLQLDSSQAQARLGWRPQWSLFEAMKETISWYSAWSKGADMRQVSLETIADYEELLRGT
ncbi:CDP-glucose 4,6-dehydratase [Sodalinema gerasimenkoae]|uniref:CDP-glucose 4,6-dehydratase n=1 Tax=Sodalinema gerasimenkoae TaxID=2862348 RepID=UPI0013580EBF|nr:CDP-glucose 4,6-dehydratase [Sodalinema gerasimenkoae]